MDVFIVREVIKTIIFAFRGKCSVTDGCSCTPGYAGDHCEVSVPVSGGYILSFGSAMCVVWATLVTVVTVALHLDSV
jgi:hypothetical protein